MTRDELEAFLRHTPMVIKRVILTGNAVIEADSIVVEVQGGGTALLVLLAQQISGGGLYEQGRVCVALHAIVAVVGEKARA